MSLPWDHYLREYDLERSRREAAEDIMDEQEAVWRAEQIYFIRTAFQEFCTVLSLANEESAPGSIAALDALYAVVEAYRQQHDYRYIHQQLDDALREAWRTGQMDHEDEPDSEPIEVDDES